MVLTEDLDMGRFKTDLLFSDVPSVDPSSLRAGLCGAQVWGQTNPAQFPFGLLAGGGDEVDKSVFPLNLSCPMADFLYDIPS